LLVAGNQRQLKQVLANQKTIWCGLQTIVGNQPRILANQKRILTK
jgi:hypothetical protein